MIVISVKIYAGVNLPATYEHSIYWKDPADKARFFRNHIARVFDGGSYVRVSDNRVKVNAPKSVCDACDYLTIDNTETWSEGGKAEKFTWYCFIMETRYISGDTTEIEFQVDVLQTFCSVNQRFTDDKYRLISTYVERETVADDTVGLWLSPDITIGEYTTNKELKPPTEITQPGTIVTASQAIKITPILDSPLYQVWVKTPMPSTLNGNYNGIAVQTFKTVDEMNDIIQKSLAGSSLPFAPATKDWLESISNITLFPADLLPETVTAFTDPNNPSESDLRLSYQFPGNMGKYGNMRTRHYFGENFQKSDFQSGELDGYAPRNKKLYTFPYNTLRLYTPDGTEKDFPFEYFRGIVQFEMLPLISNSPQISYAPIGYLGKSYNVEEAFTQTTFPQGAISSDAYTAWWAQNAPGMEKRAIMAAATIGVGAAAALATGGAAAGAGIKAIVGGATQVGDMIVTAEQAKRTPNNVRGSIMATANAASGNLYASCEQLCLRAEYLRIIDDYFSRYGYAIREFKQIRRGNRRHFTYVKTTGGAAGLGSIPNRYKAEIDAIFGAGVTWWNGDLGHAVGNYTEPVLSGNTPEDGGI